MHRSSDTHNATRSVTPEVIDEDLGDRTSVGEEAEMARFGDLGVFGPGDRLGRFSSLGRRRVDGD